ncbi:hypothetical protein BGZ82_009537 [Podila clonocystis]|nr:hypothetical protein BGZ82_009537 [Podila clonocystis]
MAVSSDCNGGDQHHFFIKTGDNSFGDRDDDDEFKAGKFEVVDIEEEAKRQSEEDFADLLRWGQERVETVVIASDGSKKHHSNLYEGPSLNETADNFEKKFQH